LLAHDHANLRAALRWAIEHEPGAALELAVSLVTFWYTRGHVREGRDWLRAALDAAPATPSRTRALALDWCGFFSAELGEDGTSLIEAAVRCARDAESPGALALALTHRAMSLPRERWAEAAESGIEARALAEAAEDPFVLAIVLNNLGVVRSLLGDIAGGQELALEAYRIRSQMGDQARMALSLGNLAEGAMDLGEHHAAREYATLGLDIARRLGHRRETVFALTTLAWIELHERRPGEARELFIEALALAHEIARPSSMPSIIGGLAAIAAATNDHALAARLAAATERAIATRFPYAELPPAQAAILQAGVKAARVRMSAETWRAEWRAGTASRIEAVAAALLEIDDGDPDVAATGPQPLEDVRARRR
jgi:hypothetical protein